MLSNLSGIKLEINDRKTAEESPNDRQYTSKPSIGSRSMDSNETRTYQNCEDTVKTVLMGEVIAFNAYFFLKGKLSNLSVPKVEKKDQNKPKPKICKDMIRVKVEINETEGYEVQ
jgi:hypothetical protein